MGIYPGMMILSMDGRFLDGWQWRNSGGRSFILKHRLGISKCSQFRNQTEKWLLPEIQPGLPPTLLSRVEELSVYKFVVVCCKETLVD
jgi:hypothetical protein